ncbi:unnamed protein product [Ectocarpus sp. 6 AP-2014]
MNRIILSGGILLSFVAVHSQSDGSRGLCWAIAVFAFMNRNPVWAFKDRKIGLTPSL